jgi:hypothetical protein
MVCMSEIEVHLARGGVDIVLLDMGRRHGRGIEMLRRALTFGYKKRTKHE